MIDKAGGLDRPTLPDPTPGVSVSAKGERISRIASQVPVYLTSALDLMRPH